MNSVADTALDFAKNPLIRGSLNNLFPVRPSLLMGCLIADCGVKPTPIGIDAASRVSCTVR